MIDLPEPDAKVLFCVPSNDPESDEVDIETLWAWRLGDDRYKLDNLPYFAYSVSTDDIILAPFNKDEGFPTFQKVIEKSGNRTIRIVFDTPAAPESTTEKFLNRLVEIGCEYEGLNRRYISINIPPLTDFDEVVRLLVSEEVQFEYADPSYAELFPDE